MMKQFGAEIINNLELVTFNDKIYALVECRGNLVDWYHKNLQYYRKDGTLKTIISIFK